MLPHRADTTIDALIREAVKQKKSVYGYGASTRGTTLLHLLETADEIDFVAERDPGKFGRCMVAGNFPTIVSEDVARADANMFLCLPWHFWSGIQKREAKWIENGGQFIVPLPEARLVTK